MITNSEFIVISKSAKEMDVEENKQIACTNSTKCISEWPTFYTKPTFFTQFIESHAKTTIFPIILKTSDKHFYFFTSSVSGDSCDQRLFSSLRCRACYATSVYDIDSCYNIAANHIFMTILSKNNLQYERKQRKLMPLKQHFYLGFNYFLSRSTIFILQKKRRKNKIQQHL